MANVEIRRLTRDDLQRGFLDVLAGLTKVELTADEAIPVFDGMMPNQFTYVALAGNRVIGTTTLLVEQKFIHSGGRVGHIEDVVVSPEVQGKGVGGDLVRYAIDQAKHLGCYKVILHCSEKVQPFYESLGFHEANVGMRIDLTP